MSRAAIMSFLPFLSKIVPEPISKMEKGRYYRNRFVAISEVILRVIKLNLYVKSCLIRNRRNAMISLYFAMNCSRNGFKNTKKITEEIEPETFKTHI